MSDMLTTGDLAGSRKNTGAFKDPEISGSLLAINPHSREIQHHASVKHASDELSEQLKVADLARNKTLQISQNDRPNQSNPDLYANGALETEEDDDSDEDTKNIDFERLSSDSNSDEMDEDERIMHVAILRNFMGRQKTGKLYDLQPESSLKESALISNFQSKLNYDLY